MKSLLIFGASSLAKLVHYYATHDNDFNVLGFIVDDQYKELDSFLSLPIHTWSEIKNRPKNIETVVYIAIGYRNMHLRLNAYEKVKEQGFQLINIVARSSFIADNVVMGNNNLIMPGVVIEPGVKMGSNNVVWSNATICHNTTLGSHNFIASNVTIGGEVCLGNQNFLGFSSVILQQRVIGDEVLVGAQSLVLNNVESLSHYQGSPARRIKDIDSMIGVCVD